MDTHYTHLEPEPITRRSARLPDEPDLDQSAHCSDDPPPETSPPVTNMPRSRKRKGRLLGGVSLGALVIVASGVFLLSPFNTLVPVPPSVTAMAGQAQQAVTSLSVPAELTSVFGQAKRSIVSLMPQGEVQTAEPGAAQSSKSGPPTPRQQAAAQTDPLVAPAASMAATKVPVRPNSISTAPYTSEPREQSMTELLKLRSDTDASADTRSAPAPIVPVNAASTKPNAIQPVRAAPVILPADQVEEPGALAPPEPVGQGTPQQVDITTAVTRAALGPPPTELPPPADPAPASVAPVPTSKPSDIKPLTPADSKVAAVASPSVIVPDAKADTAGTKAPILVLAVPAGHQEQAEVLQFVTGLSSEIARLRTENETFRKDIARRIAEQDGRMSDFNRRVSVAEARAALRSAADAGKSDEAPADPATRAPVAAVVTPALQVAVVRSPQPAAARPRYRVQAASPGLALLAEVGRGGGDGAQLQVAVGDQVPGYGVVKSVAQRGPNWVVQTEHGQID